MKKTIFLCALTAITAIAQAELTVQPLDWSYTTTTNVSEGVLTNANSAISFTTDLGNITSWYVDFSLKSTTSTGTAAILSTGRTVNSSDGATGASVQISDGELSVGTRSGFDLTATSEYSLAYNANDTYRMAFDAVNGTLYLINLSTSAYVNMDYNSALLLTTNFTAWTNTGKEKVAITCVSAVTGSSWSESEFRQAVQATVSVPEPATASLSLLALGALALRRRRK